jgi:hypothetical protein
VLKLGHVPQVSKTDGQPGYDIILTVYLNPRKSDKIPSNFEHKDCDKFNAIKQTVKLLSLCFVSTKFSSNKLAPEKVE